MIALFYVWFKHALMQSFSSFPWASNPSNLVNSVGKFYKGPYIPTDVLKSVMPV